MQVLALTSYHPAQILGLSGGQITIGAPADLVLIDIDRSWQIRGQTFASLSGSTPFEGAPVQGKVLGTWVDGTRVFDPQS
jgi:dihydroorotase